MSVPPEIWGSHCWIFIHILTIAYPENPTDSDKKSYRTYFDALSDVLPCKKCRLHMKSHLRKMPLSDDVLSSRKNLIRWGIDFHNIVNYYTGKKMLSYSDALNEISNNTRKKSSIISHLAIPFIIVVIFVLLLSINRISYIKKMISWK